VHEDEYFDSGLERACHRQRSRARQRVHRSPHRQSVGIQAMKAGRPWPAARPISESRARLKVLRGKAEALTSCAGPTLPHSVAGILLTVSAGWLCMLSAKP
jgi:hypothetical protein